MDTEAWRKRTLWRAHHRGIKEADMLVGGFADRWLAEMDEAGQRWFEALLEEQDVDILAWAFGTAIYWNAANGNFTTTAASAVACGYSLGAALAADTVSPLFLFKSA